MITIKDVAKKANVSVCTVSRTLSNKDNIKPETRERVLQAVKELDYHPNNLAVSLKTGSTKLIGLIVPDILNYYYTELAKYIERYANKAGYMVLLFSSDYKTQKEKEILQRIKSIKVNGMIIVPCANEYDHFSELKKENIPYVFLNRSIFDEIDRCIRVDNFTAAYDVISFMIENGYQKIGAIFQSFRNMIYEERFQGMMQALKDHNVALDVTNILFNVDDLDQAYKPIKEVLDKKDRPDAIFASNDMLALEVYKAANICNLKIPCDLAVIGNDDTLIASKIFPSLTSYKMPAKEMSKKAVDYLIKSHEDFINKPLKGKLIIRDSIILKKSD